MNMNLRAQALNAANIADRLTWQTRTKMVDGEKVFVVPAGEATAMKEQLIAISHVLNDIADNQDASN
ncbi:hypothetical protein ACFOMH_18695 [Paracoccus mangrovi]|uniref:Uncharacterized protein n=1 Tax=Paracoccus mangrovi TaxID=1715645 RepID=A0ABV7R8W9_9RHOB